MSDFKNITDFRKTRLSKYPYQDPTYLSFVILFDFGDGVNSPFLANQTKDSVTAESFLRDLAAGGGSEGVFYEEKLEALLNFKKALVTINNELPWYWQSIGGLERVLQWDPLVPYAGGSDAIITIETLESLNLPISGLMQLYRTAVFDSDKWTYVIPANLRKFRMYVYITEVREIQSEVKLGIGGMDGEKLGISVKDANEGILGNKNRPYFMFELRFCEFDMKSGTTIFSDLKKSPDTPAASQIVINYEVLNSIQSRVLQGIIAPSNFNADKISPSPNNEGNTPTDLLGFAKQKGAQILKDSATRGVTDLRNMNIQKMQELQANLKANTIGKAKAAMNNAYSDFIRGVDGVGDVGNQTRNIGAAIQSNVFGLSGNSTNIGGALNNAAAGSLGNVYE